jgi:hypothetical protein
MSLAEMKKGHDPYANKTIEPVDSHAKSQTQKNVPEKRLRKASCESAQKVVYWITNFLVRYCT